MSPVDWGAILQLVPQAGLVVLFMWYTRERDRVYLASQKERDADWRTFLVDERDVRHKAIDQLATEMQAMSKILSANQSLIIQHDTHAHTVWAELLARGKGS